MRCASTKTLTIHTQTLSLSFVIMSKSVILSLLAQGTTATEILTILDMLVESIVEENIDDVAGYYAVL
jgi:hypothetical protein